MLSKGRHQTATGPDIANSDADSVGIEERCNVSFPDRLADNRVRIVPWLLLAATLLFAFDGQIRRWTASDAGVKPSTKVISTLAVTTYSGYFNGGLGIVLLSLFSSLGLKDVNLMVGLKNTMSFILSTASVVTFAIAGIVYWKEAAIVMVMATTGGHIGAIVARKLPGNVFRFVAIFIGLAMSLIFFLR